MNTVLWIVQGLLALVFLMTGMLNLVLFVMAVSVLAGRLFLV